MATNPVKCPSCGHFDTKPYSQKPDTWSGALFNSLFNSSIGTDFGVSFYNPVYVEKFKNGETSAYCNFCRYIFEYKDTAEALSKSNGSNRPSQSIEDRLKELQNLKSKGLVSEEEYETKRKELLNQL